MDATMLFGASALALALVSAFMRTMPALRLFAAAAAAAAIGAGAIGEIAWLWTGAVLVLGVHVWRYYGARAATERLTRGDSPPPSALFALVNRETLAPGQILFKRGEPGSEMYLIVEGEVEIVEFGKTLGAGALLGEVALVVPSHRRTATARAVGMVTLARMTKRDMELTALHDPAFGFELLRLVARRLSDDIERLERRA
jgi:CRP/FNR family transcriptional regulator, cyclic AMP receptor protein